MSLLILKQGVSLFSGSFGELTDASVSPRTQRSLKSSLQPLTNSSSPIHSFHSLRAQRSGANIFVDVAARVPSSLSVSEAVAVEDSIREALIQSRPDVREVRVKFVPFTIDEDSVDDEAANGKEKGR